MVRNVSRPEARGGIEGFERRPAEKASGTANLKGLAGQTQINASRVQDAFVIHVANDNDE